MSEQEKLLPCPFCGGNAAVTFKDKRLVGWHEDGTKTCIFRVVVICQKCHARGKPIDSGVAEKAYENPVERELFLDAALRPWMEQAIEAWNRRSKDE